MANSGLHPGGLPLTRRLLSLAPPDSGSRVLDIGCGDGASAAFIQENYACRVYGVEPDSESCHRAAARTGISVSSGYAEQLPFAAAAFDLVYAECVLSLTQLDAALAEIFRVLVPGGVLLLSDLYARGEYALAGGMLRHLYPLPQWQSALRQAGFTIEHSEDASDELKTYLAQMIFEHGLETAYCSCGLNRDIVKTARPGYALFLARKSAPAPVE